MASSFEGEQKPTRILFAIHASRDADTAVYKNTRDRAAYLQQHGYECTVVSPDDFPGLGRIGARFTPLTFPLALAWWLLRRTKHYDAAIFHSYAGWVVLALAHLLPCFRRLRMAIQFHGLEPLYYARLKSEAQRKGRPLSWQYRLIHGCLMLNLLRRACRQADLVLCLNSEEERFLIEHKWTSNDRVRLVANPAQDSFFIQREYRKHATKLLFVGQWLNMKGIHTLAEAFTTVHRQNPDLQLVCAGTLASVDEVLREFSDDVRQSVSVFPRVNESQLLHLHREADFFVFPTLSEGFSLALIEAMASGLPIVTTAVGAAPDILQDGHSAVFCQPNQAQPLASSIADLLDDIDRREWLGRNAQLAAEKLRPEYVWRDYSACIKQLLQREDQGHREIAIPRPTEGD